MSQGGRPIGMTGAGANPGRHPLVLSLLSGGISIALLTSASPAYAADGACRRPVKALAYACGDPTLAASISALGVVYDIALESAAKGHGSRARLVGGHAAWIRDVQACGTDESCISNITLARQRAVNEERLGPPDITASMRPADTAGARESRQTIPLESAEAAIERSMPDIAYAENALPMQPRTDWPTPPTGPFTIPAAGLPAASAASAPPVAGLSAVRDEPRDGDMRILLGLVMGAGVPVLIGAAVALRSRKPRCPRCQGTMITSSVVNDVGGYQRRRGPSNGMSQVRAQHVVRRCPCGYASDGDVRHPDQGRTPRLTTDDRPEYLLTEQHRIVD